MKTLKFTFVKSHSLGRNTTMGDAYRVKCPFCATRDPLCVWPCEFEKREIRTDTRNVCEHFDGFTKDGRAIMRPKMSIVRHGNVIRVNGAVLQRSMVQFINDLENLSEEASTHDWIQWPSWCPKRRFDALYKEAWRVYGPNGDKWKAQHSARVEDQERAEFKRLKAKYGA